MVLTALNTDNSNYIKEETATNKKYNKIKSININKEADNKVNKRVIL